MLADVQERYVSRIQARALYGVAIAGAEEDDSLSVDLPATEALRRKRGAAVRRPAPAGGG